MKYLVTFGILWLASVCNGQQKPSIIWPTASPEEVGLTSSQLNELFTYVRIHKTRVHSLQVLRHGKLVMDAYFYPFQPESRHDVASVTKSITSTLVGISIDKNLIPGVTTKVLPYFYEYKTEDPLKASITLEDLLTMRSGFDCGTNLADPKINLDQRLIEIRKCPDWIACILNLPMATEPGSTFAYCNGNCHLVSALVSKSAKMSLSQLARQELFDPLDIQDAYWPTDPKGINYGWSDLQLHPYDMVKIGQLMLNRGKWNGKQILSEKWLASATREQVVQTGGRDHYGYFWWVPGADHPDVFEAVGRGGQRITVWPWQDMVIVFTGGGFDTSELIPFVVNAIKSAGPIAEVEKDSRQLKENLELIRKSPQAKPPQKLPDLAARVAGKTYQLSSNGSNIKTLRLDFGKNEATLTMLWENEQVKCNLGLDGVERFSMNPILKLSQACTGHWGDENTFHVSIDLVAGINSYDLSLTFSGDGKTLSGIVKEGTGLNQDTFKGEVL